MVFVGEEEGNRDRNHSSDTIRDISSDHSKRVSVQQFISNHGSGKRVRMGWDEEEERKRRSFDANL